MRIFEINGIMEGGGKGDFVSFSFPKKLAACEGKVRSPHRNQPLELPILKIRNVSSFLT